MRHQRIRRAGGQRRRRHRQALAATSRIVEQVLVVKVRSHRLLGAQPFGLRVEIDVDAPHPGAGGGVDGQVLVLHDMLGITHEFHPRFLRRYMNLYDDIKSATESYIKDVKSKDFQSEKEQY